MTQQQTQQYEIWYASAEGNDWEVIPASGDENRWDTEQEAQDYIDVLRALGDDWAEAQYDVRPVRL